MDRQKRNPTIDVIKGFSIILVLISHFVWSSSESKMLIFPFVVEMAVPVFMIVSGYTYSLSFSRRTIDSMNKAYSYPIIVGKTVRYTMPFLLIVLWELFDPNIQVRFDSISQYFKWIIVGTIGKGSYYYPIMIQLIFLFPIVYFVIINRPKRGLITIFIATFVFEILKWAYGMNEECYRLLLFRYLFLIAAGAFASMGYTLSVVLNITLTLIGAMAIVFTTYFKYEPIVFNYWVSTNLFSSLFVVPLMVFLLQRNRLHFPIIEMIGRASYHIFLVQMVYYLSYYEKISNLIDNRMARLLGGILICLIAGWIFYAVEMPMNRWIGKWFEDKGGVGYALISNPSLTIILV